MTTRRLLLAVSLTFAGLSTGAATAADEAAISRFATRPARPLRDEDLEISIAVPRLEDVEGDVVRRESFPSGTIWPPTESGMPFAR